MGVRPCGAPRGYRTAVASVKWPMFQCPNATTRGGGHLARASALRDAEDSSPACNLVMVFVDSPMAAALQGRPREPGRLLVLVL